MTAIPWTVVDPDTIERMIAVGLCRRHVHARRVKASQGDGGLDVLVPISLTEPFRVENYQVKKFADGLDASRRHQIKKSLKSAVNTHKNPDSPYAITAWRLAMPLDLTREQEEWLAEVTTELEAPFPVTTFGLTPIEELLIRYPNIREYYLGDGLERVRELMAQMSTLAGLEGLSAEPGHATAGESAPMLSDLHAAINAADPHFNYGFEVGDTLPVLAPVPGRIASTVERLRADAPYVTWHISTKYDAALEDRSVPGGYTVHPDRMTAEQRVAWERWRIYGAPVDLVGDVVEDFSIDLPGGLGGPLPEGEHIIRIGPAAGEFDDEPTSRSLWVIEDANGSAVAERLFHFRLQGRGMQGGEYRQGLDAEGYMSADLYSRFDAAESLPVAEPGSGGGQPADKPAGEPRSRDPQPEGFDPRAGTTSAPGTGSMHISLHLHGDRLLGQPVQRVLPALRFAAACGDGHLIRPRDEFSLAISTQAIPLPPDPLVPAVVVAAVEDLVRISSAARRPINVPERLQSLAEQRGAGLRIIADSVSGLEPEIGVGELVVWYEDVPGALDDLATKASAGELVVPWSIGFPLLGDGFTFYFSLEVLSAVTLEPTEPTDPAESAETGAQSEPGTDSTNTDGFEGAIDEDGGADAPDRSGAGDDAAGASGTGAGARAGEAARQRRAVRVVATESTRGRLRWHGGHVDESGAADGSSSSPSCE